MSQGKRRLEHVKTLLILALTASALYLAWMTGLFQHMLPERTAMALPEPSPEVYSYPAAALPICAAASGASGLVHGVCYDDGAMEALLEEFRSVLGETLGSATAPEPVEEEAWREALLGPGLFLEYRETVSLNVLARWMGSAASFDARMRVSRLFLSPGEQQVRLYYLDAAGAAYRCETLALSSALQASISTLLPNGAEFAMQLSGLGEVDPYALILRELPKLSSVLASEGEREAALQKAAELCAVKLSPGSSFQEQGVTVYLGENGRLRLETDGSLHYLAAEDRHLGEARGETEQIELSRSLLSQLAAACGGLGELEYTETLAGDGAVLYHFEYRLQGMRVKLLAGAAGWAVFRDGVLKELGFRPRAYKLTGERVARIPPLQAAAAAGSVQPGGIPELILADPGAEALLEPVWTLREGSA